MKINKKAFLIVALIAGTIGFTNCGSSNTTTTGNNSNTAVVTNSKPATNTEIPKNTEVAKTDAPAGDKIGVPECDEYIEKYEACLNSKVPEAQRTMFKSSFETMRKTWKDAAANPQAKAALATGCRQATENAKQAMGAYSCNW